MIKEKSILFLFLFLICSVGYCHTKPVEFTKLKGVSYGTFRDAKGNKYSLVLNASRHFERHDSDGKTTTKSDVVHTDGMTYFFGTVLNREVKSGVFSDTLKQNTLLLEGDLGFFFSIGEKLAVVITHMNSTIWWPKKTEIFTLESDSNLGLDSFKKVLELDEVMINNAVWKNGKLFLSGIGGEKSFFAYQGTYADQKLGLSEMDFLCYTSTFQDLECRDESTNPWKNIRKQLQESNGIENTN